MNNKNTVIITGASSGLGKSLCKNFSASYNVVNISRTIALSEHNIIVDLSNLEVLKKNLELNKIQPDLCILNAGTMGSIGLADQINDIDLMEALKVNVVANKIIVDWGISNGCKNFIGISSGAAIKNYDGWLNYCVTKSAFRSMFLQYQKDLPRANFKLISPGILSTDMNKKIKALDVTILPDMSKFHETPAVDPSKASDIIYRKYREYLKCGQIEIDLRNEAEW